MDSPLAPAPAASSASKAVALPRLWARWALVWVLIALLAALLALSQLALPWSFSWPVLGVGRLLAVFRWTARFGAFGLPLLAFLFGRRDVAEGRPAGRDRQLRRGLLIWNAGLGIGTVGILAGFMSPEPWAAAPLPAVLLLILGALIWTHAYWSAQAIGSTPEPRQQAALVSLVGLILCLVLGSVLVGTQSGLGQALGGSLFGRGLGELWLFPAALAAAAVELPRQAGRPLFGRRSWNWGLWIWLVLASIRLPLDLAPDLLTESFSRLIQAMSVLALIPLSLLAIAAFGSFVGSPGADGAKRAGFRAWNADVLIRIGFLAVVGGRVLEAVQVPPAMGLLQFSGMTPYGAEIPAWPGMWLLSAGLLWRCARGWHPQTPWWPAAALLAGAALQMLPLWPAALVEVATGPSADLLGLAARLRLPGFVLLMAGVVGIAYPRRSARDMSDSPSPAVLPEPAKTPFSTAGGAGLESGGWMPVLAWSAAIMTAGILLSVLIPLADPANYADDPRRAARALDAGSLRAEGRAAYIAEGCVFCHSQRLRADVDGGHLGPPTRAADFADGPALMGLRRAGPDLAWAGDRFQDAEVLAERLSVHAAGGRPAFPWLFEPAGPSPSGAAVVDYLIGLRASAAPEPATSLPETASP